MTSEQVNCKKKESGYIPTQANSYVPRLWD